MAISAELKKIYSDYGDTRRYYDTVQLFHPTFNVAGSLSVYPSETLYPSNTLYPADIDTVGQSFFLVRDTVDHVFDLEGGVTGITFLSYPFNVMQPQAGEDQQDIGIVLDNVSREILSNIELAATTSIPIVMTFRVFMDGDTTSQITPLSMNLTEIVVDMFTVSCKASRTDLFSRTLPHGKGTYYDNNFKGLLV